MDTYLAYNGADSFCFDLMDKAACADQLQVCEQTYGENSTLMDFPTQDIVADVLQLAERQVLMPA